MEIKKQNITEMLAFTFRLRVDAKLTTINNIMRNFFVKQAKSDS